MAEEAIPSSSSRTVLWRSALRYGGLTATLLMGYFLLMLWVGLAERIELRYLNVFILISGVLLAFRSFHRRQRDAVSYARGLRLGFLTSMVAGLLFSASLYVFLRFVSPESGIYLLEHLQSSYLNLEVMSLIVFFEAGASGFVMSVIVSRYFPQT